MRYLKYISLLLLPLLCNCDDQRFADELLNGKGAIKYLFMASIEDESVESRVAFEPEDHEHGDGHFHDLALHWQPGDKVVLNNGSDDFTFEAEEFDDDGSPTTPSRIVFVYRGSQTIPNETAFTGTATYTPTYSEDELWQSENSNADHLKGYGPVLKATLNAVNLTGTVNEWLETGRFEPIRFTPASDSKYAYLKIEVSGFKYPIWGGGKLWVYILDEGTADYNDYQTPVVTLKYGTAPSEFVSVSGNGENNNSQGSYLWPNLYSTKYRIGSLQKKTFKIGDDGYYMYDDDGKRVTTSSGFVSISFPNIKSETPFIPVDEYFVVTPKQDTNATDYTYATTNNTGNFDAVTYHYKKNDKFGNFYVPLPCQSIKKGNKYIATVLQCGWSGDLYIWEKKVPEDMTFEPGKFYVLDYKNHKPEYALKITDVTYIRSAYLEQNDLGTDAPRYSLLGLRADENGIVDNPNRIVGSGMLSADDVKEMKRNHGAFVQTTTQIASIFPRKNLVTWQWDTTKVLEFKKEWSSKGASNFLIMEIHKTDGSSELVHYDDYVEKVNNSLKGYYGIDNTMDNANGIWETKIFRNDVAEPENYKTKTMSYMSKITKGVINPSIADNLGEHHKNCYEYVLKNQYDPVMASTKTSNLWRMPYGVDINSLCNYNNAILISPNNDYFIIESVVSGHRIMLPRLVEYSIKLDAGQLGARSPNYDGSGKYGHGKWVVHEGNYSRVAACRCVMSFGTGNPAYMQACSVGIMDGEGIPKTLGTYMNFDLALPVIPVFRWKIPEDNAPLIITW